MGAPGGLLLEQVSSSGMQRRTSAKARTSQMTAQETLEKPKIKRQPATVPGTDGGRVDEPTAAAPLPTRVASPPPPSAAPPSR
mmetsp:Transcript_177/g.659  ORF Transcript_177/g.659 Transcript_177/m.659 type:complete len:83 (+) Transcript_177:204-452(+)